jgi:hypothetical protein
MERFQSNLPLLSFRFIAQPCTKYSYLTNTELSLHVTKPHAIYYMPYTMHHMPYTIHHIPYTRTSMALTAETRLAEGQQ